MKLQWLAVLACVLVTGAFSQYRFPLRASGNNRYFVDQNGTPFFLNGDAPWDMPAGLSYTDSKRYIDNADSNGFTFVVVRMITKRFTSHAPNNAYDVPPFTGAIFRSTINEPYWKHVDSVIGYCATKNIVVWAFPDYLGYGGPGSTEGFYDETTSASATQMKVYGDSLGRRYAAYPNIIWGVGGDWDPTGVKPQLDSMMAGINSYCNYPRTPRNEPETFASDHWNRSTESMSISFNGFYSYSTTLYSLANNAYNWRPTMPFILQETSYENEHSSTQQSLHAQAWYSVLGGSTAGQVFGNCPIWNFSQSSYPCGTDDWRIHLYDPGRKSMRLLKTILTPRSWYTLIPDTNNVVADSGFGSSTTYCTTAYASDSSCIVTYMPTRHQIRIKLNYLKGSSVTCKWVDPASGTETNLGQLPGVRTTFTPPASGDWLFVADGGGSSSPPSPPLLTTPSNGATGVPTNPTLTWNASSGASSYRVQVSADPGFTGIVTDQSNIAATSTTVNGLASSTQYYWHVNATNNAGTSAYSSTWSFTTAVPPPPPPAPVLSAPVNGATNVSTTPTLTWNASSGATSYRLQVSTSPAFSTTVVDQSNISSTSFTTGSLTANTAYYWHVSASNAGGTSAYSAAWSFTTMTAPSGLAAAYALDEGSGTTVTDASGHGITGTTSGTSWTTAGKYGNALSFNGSTSYVDLGNPSSLQMTGSMTLSAWVKATANPSDDGQIIAKSDGSSGWQLKTTPDTGPQTFGVAITSSTGRRIQRYSTTVRSLNTWYHVAGVYNATTQTLDCYVNGVLDDGTLSGTVPSSLINSTTNAYIGRRAEGYYFSGIIDEVRIYNRALTQAEIQTDMNTPLGTPPSPPSTPVLSAPPNGSTGVVTSPTLTWNTSPGATSYRIQVSADSTFATTVVDQGNISVTSFAASLVTSTRYFWRVNATNPNGTSGYSIVWNFTTVTPPPSPVLASPSNGSTGIPTSTTLAWNISTGATSYRIQVSADSTFVTTLVNQGNISATSFAASLAASTRYFWRVNATNASGTSAYSTVWNFTTVAPPPAPPVLAAPANGSTGVAPNPTLTWNASTGATSYRVQASIDSMFGTTVADQSNITTTSFALTGLVSSTTYFWHVNATSSSGTSAYSTLWRFTTAGGVSPPPAPILSAPVNGATNVSTAPTLAWNASSGATSYRLQVSTSPAFSTTVVDQSNISSTSFTTGSLTANTAYYWHVSASNSGGASAYSAAWSFTTMAAPSGLAAAYALDEGSGTTVTDASGHGITGTTSGTSWTTAGKYGNALSFNGSTSYVDLGNPSSLQMTGSMTLSAWVKATANPSDDGQIIAKSDGSSGWQLKTTPDTGPQTFGVAITSNTGRRIQRYSTTVRSLNTWYHVAGVYNATTQTLDCYVNGVLDNGTLSAAVPSSQVNSSANANIGRRAEGYYFSGIIDEVRIYNRVLTQAEIQSDMNTPLGTSPSAPGRARIVRIHPWRADDSSNVRLRQRGSSFASTGAEIPMAGSVTNAQANGVPEQYSLGQNYPNPFNPETTIGYTIPKESQVVLQVFDILGECVATLENRIRKPGFYEVSFHAEELGSGMYIYRIQAGNFAASKKLLLLK